jgi:hypothetical protein
MNIPSWMASLNRVTDAAQDLRSAAYLVRIEVASDPPQQRPVDLADLLREWSGRIPADTSRRFDAAPPGRE